MPTRMRPTNEIAPEAILVGDPGRALMLAQQVLVDPKMSNHARGLWGYTAESIEGRPLTIQATGMGGPSAAIVIRDLTVLGIQRAIRIGSCRALRTQFELADVLVVDTAQGIDGTSRALAGGGPAVAEPDARLREALSKVGPACTVISRDLDLPGAPVPAPGNSGDEIETRPAEEADVADLQTATTLMLAAQLELSAATLLVVEWSADGGRCEAEQLDQAVGRAGAAAARAFAEVQPEA